MYRGVSNYYRWVPKSPIVNCRVEQELYSALRLQARQQGVKWSEYIRVLLRQGAGVCDLRESGYREGKIAAYAEARRRFEDSFSDVPATLERAERGK